MATYQHKALAWGTVSTGYDAAATTIVLTAGHGAHFPTIPTGGAGFYATWWNYTDYPNPMDDANAEVVLVTAVSTDTLTIVRAQDETSAATHNTGGKTYRFMQVLTASEIDALDIETVDMAPALAPTIQANTCLVVSGDYEIVSGQELTIASGGALEVI